MPGEVDRYNMRRLVSMTANIEGEDLGRVAERIAEAHRRPPGTPPAGVQVDVRGQVTPMHEMFHGLALGLAVAVRRDLPAADGVLPVGAAGADGGRGGAGGAARRRADAAGDRTTLNIQSFMGAIMAVGVAVANAILLVTFAERYRREGTSARSRPALKGRGPACGRS